MCHHTLVVLKVEGSATLTPTTSLSSLLLVQVLTYEVSVNYVIFIPGIEAS